jgi:hypothetical protein
MPHVRSPLWHRTPPTAALVLAEPPALDLDNRGRTRHSAPGSVSRAESVIGA